MSDTDAVVLVVEDEPDVAETYRLWLEDRYTVEIARNGNEALEQLGDHVDVVLLDRMMPGLSGDEVLAEIRERALDCRVAMVTAVEPDFDILEMGFDTYLSKPVKSEQLQRTVRNLLERAEYDSLLQRYYSLVETQVALEATKPEGELSKNEEYRELCAQVERLRDELTGTLDGVEDDEDFVATIRGISDAREN